MVANTSKRIIKIEFLRKREELLRNEELRLALDKIHTGNTDNIKADMKPFTRKVKKKLLYDRKNKLIK